MYSILGSGTYLTMHLLYLTFVWFVARHIDRFAIPPVPKFAAFVAAAELYGIFWGSVSGRFAYPDLALIIFVVAGGIAAHSISTEVHRAMARAREVVVVAVLGIAFGAMFCMSVYSWLILGTGGEADKVFAALGLVGIMALPSSVWGRLLAEIF